VDGYFRHQRHAQRAQRISRRQARSKHNSLVEQACYMWRREQRCAHITTVLATQHMPGCHKKLFAHCH
jgi:hypothetical protein